MRKQEVFSQRVMPMDHHAEWVSAYDVRWRSQSTCSRDSMPLGDGDTGLNIWVEKQTGLHILIGRSDTLDHMKLCKIHLVTEPNVFDSVVFSQELSLVEGTVRIITEQGSLTIWMDASTHDLGCGFLHISGQLTVPVVVRASLDLWRSTETIDDGQMDFSTYKGHDLFQLREESLVRCHFHKKYGFDNECVVGCELSGEGFDGANGNLLETTAGVRTFDVLATVYAEDARTPDMWRDGLVRCQRAYSQKNAADHRKEHVTWWRDFWSRSRIETANAGMANRINSQYALQRFLFACSSRGLLPSLYNGSLFRTEIEKDAVAAFHWIMEEKTNADFRPWQSDYMGQNTRHQFWPLLASGDYDLIEPLVRLIRGRLKYQLRETWETMGHAGGFTPEKFADKGFTYHASDMETLDDAARNCRQHESWEKNFWHLQYHFLPTIEFLALFIDVYLHNQDRKFLHEVILPLLDACVDFYDAHYPQRDDAGRRCIFPASTAETYGKARSGYHEMPQREDVTNPVSEVAGLRYILSTILSLDPNLVSKKRMERLQAFLNELPDVPEKRVCGTQILAPGERYSPGLLCEAAELYAVWPFRQYTLYSDSVRRAAGRQSFFTRRISLDGSSDVQPWETGGWHPAGLHAATLGLAKEAARILELNFADHLPTVSTIAGVPYMERPTKPRFEGFWNHPHMDGIPDLCHAGVSMNLLQHMLLQWNGREIHLLPAWEPSWDVSFRLHAPFNTVVDCEFRHGQVRKLTVTPESRLGDVINCQTEAYQIKNILCVHAGDRNPLFQLPPMQDGILTREDIFERPLLKLWLEKYAQSVMDVSAFPLSIDGGLAFFRDHYLYIHLLERKPMLEFPALHAKPVRVDCLTGGTVHCMMEQDTWHLDLSESQEDIVTIVRITADRPFLPETAQEEIAGDFDSSSDLSESFRAQHVSTNDRSTYWIAAQDDPEPVLHCAFDGMKTIGRMEIHVMRPDRGFGKTLDFTIHVPNDRGDWHKVLESRITGELWSQWVEGIHAREIKIHFNNTAEFGVRHIGFFQ